MILCGNCQEYHETIAIVRACCDMTNHEAELGEPVSASKAWYGR